MKKLTITIVLFLFCLTIVFSQQVDREFVAVELSIGTWCYYCPGGVTGVNDLIANGDDVAVIINHTGDAYGNVYSNDRIDYYGVYGFPDARFDGVLDYIGGQACPTPGGLFAAYHANYEARKAIMSSFTLNLDVTIGDPGYDAVITVDQVDTDVTENCVVHLFVTESNISESWQGCMTELDYVNRLMVPDEDGTPLNLSGSQQVINLNFSLDAGWNAENCEVVAFLQNNTTKEVYQCTKVSLPDPPPPVERELVAVELFIGTWCYYCPGGVTGVNDMIANGDDVGVIINHTGDAYENVYSNDRIDYYGVYGYPTVNFDGVLDYAGGQACPTPGGLFAAYHEKYNIRKAILSSFTLSLDIVPGSSGYDAVITVDKVSDAVTDNCVVHLFVTESNISESWQGCMTALDYVNRLMVPDEDGTPLNLSGSQQIINLDFALDAGWNAENCEIVVILQNNTSKEVYQCTKADLPAGPPDDLAIDGDIVSSGEDLCWFATNSIEVPVQPGDYLIESGASVELIAGSVITLNPGFHAVNGSYMHAYISSSGCPPPPEVATGIQGNQDMETPVLQLSPNPANNMVYIGFSDPGFNGEAIIYLYNIVGERKLEKKVLLSGQYELDIMNIPPGIYIVNVIMDDHTFTGKLVKQ